MQMKIAIRKTACVLNICATALVCAGALATETAPKYLCKPEETVLFGCESGKKMISVCASHGFSAETGYVQYRIGTPARIELSYPETLTPAKGHFWYSFTGYSGGAEAHLRFGNQGVTYVVFDRTVRTNFVPGEPNYPDMSEGVVVLQQGKKATKRLCTASRGGIYGEGYEGVEREDFDDGIVP
jgi:hypothetical protein